MAFNGHKSNVCGYVGWDMILTKWEEWKENINECYQITLIIVNNFISDFNQAPLKRIINSHKHI